MGGRHGYYRAGFSSLRNVLEVMTVGTCGCLNHTTAYDDYRGSSAEFKFGTACDQLSRAPSLAAFNQRMHDAGFRSLWDAKEKVVDAGMLDCSTGNSAICAHATRVLRECPVEEQWTDL